MRRILFTLLLSATLSASVGCFLPIYSGDPTHRAQQLIFTSEDLRAFVDVWDCTIRDNFVTMPDPELGYGIAVYENGTVELGGGVTLTGNGTAAIAINGSRINFQVSSCDLTGSGPMETAWHSSISGYGICTSGLPERCVYSHNDDTACCSVSENGPCKPFP